MIHKPNYLMQFLGKAIWGGLVLIVSALLFAFVSVIVSTKVHDEPTIMIAFLIVGPFTAIISLMGFNKIKQKVECIKLSKLVEGPDLFRIYVLNIILFISATFTTFLLLITQSNIITLLISIIITFTNVIFIYFQIDKIINDCKALIEFYSKFSKKYFTKKK